ncbi:MAG: hypothetical protein ACE5F7_08410 [Nitrospiria bacterium]
MEIQYTEVSEMNDASEVEILIADHRDFEMASNYIEMKVALPKQKNPLLAQIQTDTLQYARDIIDQKIQAIQNRVT